MSDGMKKTAPGGFHHQGPDAPSAHRRPGYPLSGCVPAEPDSVSPGNARVISAATRGKAPSDTGAMPEKIRVHEYENQHNLPTRFGEEPVSVDASAQHQGAGRDRRQQLESHAQVAHCFPRVPTQP